MIWLYNQNIRLFIAGRETMISKIYSFLASFFWGNWFFRLIQAALFVVVIIFISLSLLCLETIRQGELGVLAAAPLIVLFIPGLLVNIALLFGLRKAKNNDKKSNKILLVSLATLSIFVALVLFVGFRG